MSDAENPVVAVIEELIEDMEPECEVNGGFPKLLDHAYAALPIARAQAAREQGKDALIESLTNLLASGQQALYTAIERIKKLQCDPHQRNELVFALEMAAKNRKARYDAARADYRRALGEAE